MAKELNIKNLDHLGLITGIVDDLNIENIVNSLIKAEEINDDKIGRVMDDIYEVSLDKLWTEIGLNVLKTYQIETKYSHLDSTSISVEGEYNKKDTVK